MKPPQVGSSHGWSQTIPGIPYMGTPLLSTRFRELKVFKLTYRGFKTTPLSLKFSILIKGINFHNVNK
jgi:hypothetical protein